MFALQCFGTDVFVCFALWGSKNWIRGNLMWLFLEQIAKQESLIFPSVSFWVLESLNAWAFVSFNAWVLESRMLWILDSLSPWLKVWQLVFSCLGNVNKYSTSVLACACIAQAFKQTHSDNGGSVVGCMNATHSLTHSGWSVDWYRPQASQPTDNADGVST